MENPDQKRIQLNSNFQPFVVLLFFVIPIIILTKVISGFNLKDIFGTCVDLFILLFSIVMMYRMKGLKRVSYSPTQFYVCSLFRSDEVSLPISRIISFEKAAFTNLRHTDIFLIRYKDFDGLDKLIKIVRSKDDPSVSTFKKLVELNQKKDNSLRGLVENKF